MPIASLHGLQPGAVSIINKLQDKWQQLARAGTGHLRLVILSLASQCWIGLAAFLSSLVLIQGLTPEDYARYTLVAAFLSMTGIFGDLGLSVGLNSMGGEALRAGRSAEPILATAIRMRWSNAALAASVLLPIHAWLLARHGTAWLTIALLLAVALLGSATQVKVTLMGAYLRLINRHSTSFRIDAQAAALRLVLLVGAAFAGLTALLAVAFNAIVSFAGQWWYRRRLPSASMAETAPELHIRKGLRTFTWQLAPSAAFHAIQGQLYIWLIALFGATQSVAEVGALSRLAMIVTVLTGGVSGALAPKFARLGGRQRIVLAYWSLTLALAAALAGVLGLSLGFPQAFRLLLGHAFQGADSDLTVAVAAQCVGGLSAFMYSLSSARGWVRRAWVGIPITIMAQIAGMMFLPLDSTRGVLWFQLLTSAPGLITNLVLLADGLRHAPISLDAVAEKSSS